MIDLERSREKEKTKQIDCSEFSKTSQSSCRMPFRLEVDLSSPARRVVNKAKLAPKSMTLYKK